MSSGGNCEFSKASNSAKIAWCCPDFFHSIYRISLMSSGCLTVCNPSVNFPASKYICIYTLLVNQKLDIFLRRQRKILWVYTCFVYTQLIHCMYCARLRSWPLTGVTDCTWSDTLLSFQRLAPEYKSPFVLTLQTVLHSFLDLYVIFPAPNYVYQNVFVQIHLHLFL